MLSNGERLRVPTARRWRHGVGTLHKFKFAQVPAGVQVWDAYLAQLLRSGASKVDTAPVLWV